MECVCVCVCGVVWCGVVWCGGTARVSEGDGGSDDRYGANDGPLALAFE